MKVLVTGADGLLGANLVRALLADGYEVRAFVMRDSKARTLDGLEAEIVQGDLLDEDPSVLNAALRGCGAVLHCAGLTDMRAPDALMWRVNSEGTRRVVEASVRAGVGRFIHTGSASSFRYGSKESPGDERSGFPLAYKGVAYAESKADASKHVLDRVACDGLDAVVVAPTFMLGAFDERPSSGELIRQFVRRNMRFTSPGGRNFAHVGDVARGMVSALQRGRTGETYLLGGTNVSYLEFFALVARAVGREPPRLVLPKAVVLAAGSAGSAVQAISRRPAALNRTMARMACMGTYYDSSKAITELSMPQTSLEQAIDESVQALREYGHI
ncbi:MAG: NAD-dependent epimerase/dehydratase family protein [Actinomycetota bacterium]